MPEWTADAWALGEEALTVTALKVARRWSSDRFGRPAAPTEPVLSCLNPREPGAPITGDSQEACQTHTYTHACMHARELSPNSRPELLVSCWVASSTVV